MKVVKRIFSIAIIILFISLIGNIGVFANSTIQNETQTHFLNSNFELTINGIKYTIITPLDAALAPITVKVIDNGKVLFERITKTSIMVVADGINHRVVGDGIDHRVVGDGIDHKKVLEVSQNGLLVLSKNI